MIALIYKQFNPLIDLYTRLLTEKVFEVFAMVRQPATNAAFDSKIDEFFALRNHDRGTKHD